MRPLLDRTHDELCDLLRMRGIVWREDATNAHTDRFRAYVRHKIVPVAKEWNSALPEVLTRSMNLIADEDDMLQNMAEKLAEESAEWVAEDDTFGIDRSEGFRLLPAFWKSGAPAAASRGAASFGSELRPGCAGRKPLAWKPCSLASRMARPTAGMWPISSMIWP